MQQAPFGDDAIRVAIAKGQSIFRPGDAPKGWVRIRQGRVKVCLTADTGREIVLYRLEAGDSCVVTASALLLDASLAAEAIAETDVVADLVPTERFHALMAQSASFRALVLKTYAERVVDLCMLVEDALFHALPSRLARVLLERSVEGAVVATHQDLASELGGAREGVTRALGRFEKEGLVRNERGAVLILDAARLRLLATRDEDRR